MELAEEYTSDRTCRGELQDLYRGLCLYILHRAAQAKCQQEEDSGILAVFLGENRWQSGTGYTFIRGALLADAGEITEEHIEITQICGRRSTKNRRNILKGRRS